MAEVAASSLAVPGSSRGSAAAAARTRKVPPKFYSTPHNKIAEPGETVRFQCNVGGNPSPRVTWDRDNIAIKPSARYRLVEERDDVRILEIRNVTVEVEHRLVLKYRDIFIVRYQVNKLKDAECKYFSF